MNVSSEGKDIVSSDFGHNVSAYLKSVRREFATGKATEHSYRAALQALVEAHGLGLHAQNEPQRVQCGAPDLIVTRNALPLGYIECKDIDVSLDTAEKSDQLTRYRESLDNLILTNYIEFRYYVQGELRLEGRLARIDAKGKIARATDGDDDVRVLLDKFIGFKGLKIKRPKELARRMARQAQLIRGTITTALGHEMTDGTLHQQMEGFKDVLLHDLTEPQFADMYAQTICYGLFAARCSHYRHAKHSFNRLHAAYDLPKTNPFLRSMFVHIAGPELDDRIAWIVDDVAELLRRADIDEILKDFGKATRQEDPVVHFYETFLAEYDSKMRASRGVYYTPEPVVSYIVRSVDHILKTDFGLPDGLADCSKVKVKAWNPNGKNALTKEVHKVQILDPATGTGTFLHGVIGRIYEGFEGNEGLWSGYVREHLLPRLHGFELLMAPYAVAHMKLGLLLQETGYDFAGDERLNIFLTNSLEEAEFHTEGLFAGMIAKEANAASRVKKNVPVMVVLGNPPYSGHSANKGAWIKTLIDDYKQVDGKPLGERNSKWLNDDYVKFIRFAQWRIEQTGHGILAFITNHGYLDNPTFRGMRQSLMKTFDDIYILDLHGNTKKRETCPDGSKDENVFDIQQGVAIGILVRRPTSQNEATVKRGDIWGERIAKYKQLLEEDITRTAWTTPDVRGPVYAFVETGWDLHKEYETCVSIRSLMPENNTGFITSRDGFVLDDSRSCLLERIQEFVRMTTAEARTKFGLGDVRERTLDESHATVENMADHERYLTHVHYRPFDYRWLFYHQALVRWPVFDIMSHMIAAKNLGIITTRQTRDQWGAIATSRACGHKSCAAYDVNSLFPLYLYSENQESLFQRRTDCPAGKEGRIPNLSPDFIKDLSAKLGLRFVTDGKGDLRKTFGPEDVFDYMYAVFHSPTYRKRYAEFLKIDFPRVPLTSDVKLFGVLCGLGDELVGLHLLERVPSPAATYPVAGDNEVGKVRYTPPNADATERVPPDGRSREVEGHAPSWPAVAVGSGPATNADATERVPPDGEAPGRVWINKTQYFEGVAEEVYNFHVGGYQVCNKWLKDRKGRQLTYDDITHYRNVITALGETIRLMVEIDAAIPAWPIA